MLIREYDMEDVEDEAWTSHPKTRELMATLRTIEEQVALVYCAITDGAISKCTTTAATVIAVAHDCADRALKAEIERLRA